jgi:two-component system phosphate regulon sensor histidine kinase PhoR
MTVVAHELKSPIAGIRLLMERIESGRLHKAQLAKEKEYYGVISREIDRMERLVNRLLELRKTELGLTEYKFASASITELAEIAINHLRPQAEAKSIQLELQIEGAIPQIALDKVAILITLENLIDNAIKYSPSDRRITIAIGMAKDKDKKPDQMCVEVRDQGAGINADDLPFIFDKFYRGLLGEQYSVKGTGLGLSLVKAVVEAHGGSIEVSSRPGEGSCFSVQLPIINQTNRE